MKKVLIAEDDLLIADMLEEVLADNGYHVCGIARNVDEGVRLVEQHQPDLMLLDLRLADGSFGSDIVARSKNRENFGIIYISGNTSRVRLTREHGHAFLRKPCHPKEILEALKIAENAVQKQTTTAAARGNLHPPRPAGFQALSANDSEPVATLLRRQTALAKFSGYALVEPNLSRILQEAAKVAAECMNAPFSKIYRYRMEAGDLFVEARFGWSSGVAGHVVSVADKNAPQARSFITGDAVICENIGAETGYTLPAFYITHRIVSTVNVIIRTPDGTAWGILEIDNPRACQYDKNDLAFLNGLANILALAAETAKRHDAAKASIGLLNDVLAERDRLRVAQAKLLEEKDELVRELQHRVQNNLQLVYGMLNREIERQGNADGSGIESIARRVMTLVKVYDHLLGAGLEKTTDFGSYLSSLCDDFRDRQNAAAAGIELVCHVDTLMLDLDVATALGLVVAELISNSYRHAFPKRTGTVKVSLRYSHAAGIGWLDFADDGVGFPPQAERKRHGIGLVKRLMAQINGEATFQSDRGTTWTLKFPVPEFMADAA
jgi:two-component sensor histidine kinase/CheY-like chemotaxis protein